MRRKRSPAETPPCQQRQTDLPSLFRTPPRLDSDDISTPLLAHDERTRLPSSPLQLPSELSQRTGRRSQTPRLAVGTPKASSGADRSDDGESDDDESEDDDKELQNLFGAKKPRFASTPKQTGGTAEQQRFKSPVTPAADPALERQLRQIAETARKHSRIAELQNRLAQAVEFGAEPRQDSKAAEALAAASPKKDEAGRWKALVVDFSAAGGPPANPAKQKRRAASLENAAVAAGVSPALFAPDATVNTFLGTAPCIATNHVSDPMPAVAPAAWIQTAALSEFIRNLPQEAASLETAAILLLLPLDAQLVSLAAAAVPWLVTAIKPALLDAVATRIAAFCDKNVRVLAALASRWMAVAKLAPVIAQVLVKATFQAFPAAASLSDLAAAFNNGRLCSPPRPGATDSWELLGDTLWLCGSLVPLYNICDSDLDPLRQWRRVAERHERALDQQRTNSCALRCRILYAHLGMSIDARLDERA